MKTTRRDFLKGLIATVSTAIIAPQALVESVHGASDLTPRERDIAAEVMGLRQEQWPGWGESSWEKVKQLIKEGRLRPPWMEIPVFQEDGQFGKVSVPIDSDPGGIVVPPEYRDRVIRSLAAPSRVSAEQRAFACKVLDSWVWKGTAEKGEFWTVEMPSSPVDYREIYDLRDIDGGELPSHLFGHPIEWVDDLPKTVHIKLG